MALGRVPLVSDHLFGPALHLHEPQFTFLFLVPDQSRQEQQEKTPDGTRGSFLPDIPKQIRELLASYLRRGYSGLDCIWMSNSTSLVTFQRTGLHYFLLPTLKLWATVSCR